MKKWWIGSQALAALFACSLGSYAQAPQVTGIGHVAYRVSDLDKEVAFLQKLGFEESFPIINAGKTVDIFVKINDRSFIELYPQTDAAQPLGWMHVCYESDALSALNDLYAAHGLKPSAVAKAGAGNLVFSLKDPEGRVTEFTQYMPGSRHTLDRGQHLGAHRVSQELQGFELPSPDLAAAKQFYTAGLAFSAQDAKAGLRVRITSQEYPAILLRAAKAGDQPQLLFRVPSVAAATSQLNALGLTVKQQNRRVSVTDPDGNIFTFMEPRSR
jgi:catechol 2,3-dioxygenase-like lactoylglutathione lyase family enzyme